MSRTIITHIGISALNEQGILKGYAGLKRLRDTLRDDRAPSDTDLQRCIDEATKELQRIWMGRVPPEYRPAQSPAEIASLSLMPTEQPSDPVIKPDDRVVLLHSDTPAGRFCAKLIAAMLQFTLISPATNYPLCTEQQIEVVQVNDLRVTADAGLESSAQGTAEIFVRKGLVSYVERIWEEYQRLLKAGGGELIFNITAGYKGMIPIARDLASLLYAYARTTRQPIKSELCYLYEDSSTLIRYAALPVLLDWSAVPEELLRMAGEKDGVERSQISDEHGILFEYPSPHSPRRRRSPLGEVVWALCQHIDYRKISKQERTHIEKQLEDLRGEYNIQADKVRVVREALLYEVDVLKKFKLEKESKDEKNKLEELSNALSRIERILGNSLT